MDWMKLKWRKELPGCLLLWAGGGDEQGTVLNKVAYQDVVALHYVSLAKLELCFLEIFLCIVLG